jgi:hypothetical protein
MSDYATWISWAIAAAYCLAIIVLAAAIAFVGKLIVLRLRK